MPVEMISYDGDIVRIQGRAVRMDHIVRDAFWANDRAIVLLDPSVFLDDPAFGSQRRRSRDPIHNLRAYAPSGELLWQADQPEFEDHYYMIESRDPLVALSFSGFRCDLDPGSGRIKAKTKIK